MDHQHTGPITPRRRHHAIMVIMVMDPCTRVGHPLMCTCMDMDPRRRIHLRRPHLPLGSMRHMHGTSQALRIIMDLAMADLV